MCLFPAHFDAKGKIEEYIQQSAPSTMQWTIVRMPFYFNNFLTISRPTPAADGSRGISIPMGNHPLAGIDVRDVGRCVVSKWLGNVNYGCIASFLTLGRTTTTRFDVTFSSNNISNNVRHCYNIKMLTSFNHHTFKCNIFIKQYFQQN